MRPHTLALPVPACAVVLALAVAGCGSSGSGSASSAAEIPSPAVIMGAVGTDSVQRVTLSADGKDIRTVPVANSGTMIHATVTLLPSALAKGQRIGGTPTIFIWGPEGPSPLPPDGPNDMTPTSADKQSWKLDTAYQFSQPGQGVGLYTVVATVPTVQGRSLSRPIGYFYVQNP